MFIQPATPCRHPLQPGCLRCSAGLICSLSRSAAYTAASRLPKVRVLPSNLRAGGQARHGARNAALSPSYGRQTCSTTPTPFTPPNPCHPASPPQPRAHQAHAPVAPPALPAAPPTHPKTPELSSVCCCCGSGTSSRHSAAPRAWSGLRSSASTTLRRRAGGGEGGCLSAKKKKHENVQRVALCLPTDVTGVPGCPSSCPRGCGWRAPPPLSCCEALPAQAHARGRAGGRSPQAALLLRRRIQQPRLGIGQALQVQQARGHLRRGRALVHQRQSRWVAKRPCGAS